MKTSIIDKNTNKKALYEITCMKVLAAFCITWSHCSILLPNNLQFLITGGALGNSVFFFCSGYTLLMGRDDNFPNWYKRRIKRIYPVLLTWYFLLGLFNGRDISVVDLIFPKEYWFVWCIMIYYAIFFFIKKYLIDHLKISLTIFLCIVYICNLFMVSQTQSMMYATMDFMYISYFLFMLLGAITSRIDCNFNKKNTYLLIMIGSFLLYYVCLLFYGISPYLCHFQIISLIMLLIFVCSLCLCLQSFESIKKVASIWGVKYISALTLEIYIVQPLINNSLNNLFPLNIIVILIMILLSAYLLKVSTNILVNIFDDKPICLKSNFTIKTI